MSEIDLRVGLCTVRLSCSMQRDNLVANHVFAWREVCRNSQVPAKVVLNHVIRDPGTRIVAAFPGAGLNLGPKERRGVYGATVAIAGRDVFLDGTGMGDRPCVPFFVVSYKLLR